MSLPAQDSFTSYSGGDDLNHTWWTAAQGTFNNISSGVERGNIVSNWASAYWNTSSDTFSANQYSQMKILSLNSSTLCVGVRMQSTGSSTSGIIFAVDTFNGGKLYPFSSGTNGSALATASTTPGDGDTMRLEVQGNVYTVKLDVGSTGSFTTVATYTDGGNTLNSSGQPGILTYDTSSHFTNFQADVISGGGGGGGSAKAKFLLLGVG